RIRADEGALADVGAMLGRTDIVAGDGACTDVGAGADPGVTDVTQVIGLGAVFDRRLFHLNEIADMDALFELGAGPKPRIGTDDGALANMGAGQMRERADGGAVLNRDA